MVRVQDPTSKILLEHYKKNFDKDAPNGHAELIVNVMMLRNTLSKGVIKLCEQGDMPWLKLEGNKFSDVSKEALNNVFLKLGGRIFFTHVEPMKSRSKNPRRGYGELVSELVSFASKAKELAATWRGGENAVENIAAGIRKIAGFGGKGFRTLAGGKIIRDILFYLPALPNITFFCQHWYEGNRARPCGSEPDGEH